MDAITAGWRAGTSTAGSGDTGADTGVETVFRPDGTVGVPDPDDRARTPRSRSAAQWSAFASAVRTGQFAR